MPATLQQSESREEAADEIVDKFCRFLSRFTNGIIKRIPKEDASCGLSVGGLIHESGAGRIEDLQRQVRKAREDFEAERKSRKKDRAELETRLAAALKKATEAESNFKLLNKSQEKVGQQKAEAEMAGLLTKCFAAPAPRSNGGQDDGFEDRIRNIERIMDHAMFFKSRLESGGNTVPKAVTDTINVLSKEISDLKKRKESVHNAKEL